MLFALFVPVVAQAQTLPTFRHIVVILQENRTPDNLFGSAPVRRYYVRVGRPVRARRGH